ncbi:hypothetical protein [Nonomuraea harbinensis]|uniref:Uncharacterized protein n=1 Tax=Nonomuraea harbinensis TaxID=1286938 RepID=A0ABW1BKF4_9ACTN|nr:hypothetical protein [Nonomuraea harbinensis]
MNDAREFATHLVDHYLGPRLDAAGSPAGLREAAIDLVIDALPDVETLMGAQLDLLTNGRRSQFPDAYLAHQAAVEDSLQRAAAGLRAAFAQAGHLGNPHNFERGAAVRLRDDPRAALRAELARIPRPLTRPDMLQWSLDPAPWLSESHQADKPWPPSGFATVAGLRSLPDGAMAFARVSNGPHAGWVQIGLFERQRTPARRYPDQPTRQLLLVVGLEALDGDPPQGTLPVSQAPWQLWTSPWQRLALGLTTESAAEHLRTTDHVLIALTDAGATRLTLSGLGLPPYVLAPALTIVAALGLEPTQGICGFSLSDASGEALVCRQWHGHLVHDGNYEPLLPAVEGADLLIRPDLFTRLHNMIDDARCRAGVNVHHMSADEDDDTFDDEP